MNGYDLSRQWFDFAFENPSKITPSHGILYFYIIEHCNRLGWKKEFGLPTTMAKEAIGIKSYNTYKKVLDDLIEWGFITMIEKSKNQYSANIVALSKIDKAPDKALDKAITKHLTKQSESTIQSIDSINKPITNKPITKNKPTPPFIFLDALIELGVEDQVAKDWIQVRKTKKASNTKTAFTGIKNQIEKSGGSANECISLAVENSWAGFKAEWFKTQKPKKLTPEQQMSEMLEHAMKGL